MSGDEIPNFQVVAEGKTDFYVIEELLKRLCTGDPTITRLMPYYEPGSDPEECGPLGQGWTGVRNWCTENRDERGSLQSRMSSRLFAHTVLIIHVDADIASHPELNCERPCPPASDTVDEVRGAILRWSGDEMVPERTVLCVPSKSTEAWVLAALYPHDKPVHRTIECRRKPESCLVQKPEGLVSGKTITNLATGRRKKVYKKDADAYMACASRIVDGWNTAQANCAQAKRLHDDLLGVIAAIQMGG